MAQQKQHAGGGAGPIPGLIPVPGQIGFAEVVLVVIELGVLILLRKKMGGRRHGG